MRVDFYASSPHDVVKPTIAVGLFVICVRCWLHVGGIFNDLLLDVLLRVDSVAFSFFPLCFHLIQGNHSRNMEMLRIRLFRMMRKSRSRRKEVLLFWRRWKNTLKKGKISQYFWHAFFFKLIGTGVCCCFCFVKMDVTQQDLEFLESSFWKG